MAPQCRDRGAPDDCIHGKDTPVALGARPRLSLVRRGRTVPLGVCFLTLWTTNATGVQGRQRWPTFCTSPCQPQRREGARSACARKRPGPCDAEHEEGRGATGRDGRRGAGERLCRYDLVAARSLPARIASERSRPLEVVPGLSDGHGAPFRGHRTRIHVHGRPPWQAE